MQTRRSSRTNKGQHSKRELDEYLDDLSDEEVAQDVKRSKPDQEYSNNEYESEDGDFNGDEIVQCTPCGANKDNYDEENDELGEMIECEQCKTWQHLSCMGLKKAPKSNYLCDVCSGETKPKVSVKRSSSITIEPVKSKPKSKSKYDLSNPIEALKNDVRISTAKAFFNFFKRSYPKEDLQATEEEKEAKALKLTLEIEEIIHKEFPGTKNYTDESRRVLFLLKKHFTKDLFAGTITLEDVVKKTPQEINADIAKIELQNKENIKNIVLVENDQTQIIRRTHKGEIIKENENEQDLTMDDSISTRKVDHRRFSSDITDGKSNIISENHNVLNNFNPAVPQSDDEDADKVGEVEIDDNSQQYNPDYLSDDEPEIQNKSSPYLWTGNITFENFASVDLNAKFYSTSSPSIEASIKTIKEILYDNKYTILGKLHTKAADEYLNKVLNTRDLLFVQLLPTNDDQQPQFQKLLDYCYDHKRVGVLSGKPSFVKDAYIMGIDFNSSNLPYYLNEYKSDLVKGLFAVYVAKKNYNISQGELKSTQPVTNNVLQDILSQLS